MSAVVIQFPSRRRCFEPHPDALSAVADLIAQKVADLPFEDEETSILKLLRSIDRKLGRLVSEKGGAI
ncbi:hypothetical protein [Pseudomonas fluorescens]|uniref:Uncharacterized protein n=1 Tax=Pseudomonas fluorescens TaxID=294 RepID=A0A109KFL5_PSEFL|nr:hypothetical protein [Pseudomonas fluorescens]KWV68373.1 hypothetical protein PFL603g_06475 [Pseudomonas fluorescens]